VGLAVHWQRGARRTLVPFLGAFGAAWDDGMVARWSANPLDMIWPEMDAAFVASVGGNGGRRPRCGAQWS
jgi:hypothetical protein